MSFSTDDKRALLRLLGVTICLPLVMLTLSIFARRYAQTNNTRLADQHARTYFRNEIPTPIDRLRTVVLTDSVLRYALLRADTDTDSFLAGLTAHLESENFDFSSQSDSSQYVAPPISNTTPLAARLSKDRQYASLYDFGRESLAHNAFDDEKQVLKSYWDTVTKENDSLDQETLDYYVRYIVDTYTVPAVSLIRSKRISRARDLLAKASDRLEFIPFEPKQFDGTLAWLLRERTFVLAALLEDEVTASLHFDSLYRAVVAIVSGYPAHLRGEWFDNANTGLSPALRSFIRSRYLLNELRYDDCVDEIEQTLRNRPSSRLRQLSLLMELHCVYERRQAPRKTLEKDRVNIDALYSQLAPTPFAAEIDYYKNALSAGNR